jgi:hypothetical protein
MGAYLPKLLEDDPSWKVRTAFHLALMFLTMLGHHCDDQPEILLPLYLRGVELMNDFWVSVRPPRSPRSRGSV